MVKVPAVAIAAALCAATLSTAGCGVPEDGRLGIGRDSRGALRVYLQTCHAPMDNATLYQPSDDSNPQEEAITNWQIDPQPNLLKIEWPLLGPGTSSIRADQPLAALPDSTELAIGGYTSSNTYSAGGPWRFTEKDVDRLRPGQVLISNEGGDPADLDRPNTVVIEKSAFDQLDCSRYG